MTTARNIEKEFARLISPIFFQKGFEQNSRNQFARPVGDVVHLVDIGPVKIRGEFRLTGGGFGIRVPKVEALLRPTPEFQGTATIAMPLHLLKPSQKYEEWFIRDVKQLPKLVSALEEDIRDYGLPFLEKFKSSEDILNRLKSEDHRDWLMCDRDYRDALLVTFEWARAGRERAMALGEQLLGAYEKRPGKYSLLLRKVLQRVSRGGGE